MNKHLLLFVLALSIVKLYGQTDIYKLSLADAIETSIKQNPELKAAIENINSAKGKFWNGISLPQPELEMSLEFIPIAGGLRDYSERTFSVSQSFEFPTNYFLRGNKLTLQEETAYQQYLFKEKSLIASVKSAYYQVLSKQILLKYAEQNLEISGDFFEKAKIRYNVGEGTNIEQLTARVQFSEAKNKMEIAINELKASFAELNYVLGYGNQNNDSNFMLTDSLIYIEHEISLDEAYREAEETNPQIKIAGLSNGIASVEKTIAWSTLLPDFNIAYFKQSRDGDNGFYGVAFGMSVPLWFLMEQRGSIQEADANKEISVAILQHTKNEISLRLKNSFTDYKNNQQQLRTYIDDIIPQAEEVYRTASQSYDAGELSYIEYMQVKQLLINARENYISSLLSYNKSLIILEEIIGKNLSELEN